MNKLLVLAYNEEKNLTKTVTSLIDNFDEIIIVNDNSSDNTESVIEDLSSRSKKIKHITNKKNYGPGKSMEIGLTKALESQFNFLIKIDGDNQFDKHDVLEMIRLAENNNSDFIKCDRFWPGGVTGKIPKIRYFGNSFASLLIKIVSGNWKLNDPLNGLFLFSKNASTLIKIPKIFFRYGYPFFINLKMSQMAIDTDLKLHQFKNKINYGDEKSQLKALNVFIKLISYSIIYYIQNIKVKLKYSSHQLSGLIDTFAITSIIFSIFSLFMTLISRFTTYKGNQGAWFLLSLIFAILFFISIFQTQKAMHSSNKNQFIYIN